jgi:drug/metabolite transporter (DMT)-like permease
MAGPILGEQVSASHWLAVFIGFIGVVIACQPGISATGPVLMAVAAAVLWLSEGVRQRLKNDIAIGRAVSMPTQGGQAKRMGGIVDEIKSALQRV